MNIGANISSEDRDVIYHFVLDFYSHVRTHTVLGPIFNSEIGDGWDEHFDTLTDFWVTVLLGAPSYKGNPFAVHQQIKELEIQHFDTWLALFAESAKRMLPAELAQKAEEKSRRIAESLRQGLFFRPA